MATILLWQFDHHLKKNKIGAYNNQTVAEFAKLKAEKLAEKEEQIQTVKLAQKEELVQTEQVQT